MENANLLAPLWIIGIAAALFIPGMLFAYRLIVIPNRIHEAKSSIWNEKAIEAYVEVFTTRTAQDWRSAVADALAATSEKARKHAERDVLDRFLLREFMAVHRWRNYALSVFPVTLVVTVVVWTCCAWVHAKLSDSNGTIAQLHETIILAMSGAYVWSVFEILTRFRSRDLVPEDLLEMNLRHLGAVPIGYAFSQLALGGDVAGALAFASAAFPLREVRRILRERAIKKFELDRLTEAPSADGRLGKLLDSLGEPALTRLEELQIVTYMDLAYLDPVRLMARTGYSLRLILAWIDQALLVVYAAPHKAKLAIAGLPCALDVREFHRDHIKGRDPAVWKTDPAVVALATHLGIEPEFVGEITVRLQSDPHVEFLAAVWSEEDGGVRRELAQAPAFSPAQG